jgi:hypothetical protein
VRKQKAPRQKQLAFDSVLNQLRIAQAKEQIARRGTDDDAADAVGRGDAIPARRPGSGRQIGALLHGVAPGCWPGNNDVTAC